MIVHIYKLYSTQHPLPYPPTHSSLALLRASRQAARQGMREALAGSDDICAIRLKFNPCAGVFLMRTSKGPCGPFSRLVTLRLRSGLRLTAPSWKAPLV